VQGAHGAWYIIWDSARFRARFCPLGPGTTMVPGIMNGLKNVHSGNDRVNCDSNIMFSNEFFNCEVQYL
jgi:hypothetical protein